ncbi:MAG: hypothetical protein R3272_04770 [Candidatus Promineifilaceae bacterium]|nr:hypothetical protein [Candidatus Promineifilaceae bacterium]
MRNYLRRLGVLPFLLLGAGLLLLGLLAINYIVNAFWPFDVARLDLVRASARGTADAAQLLEAATLEVLFAFLASVVVATTGLALPLAYYINRRFSPPPHDPAFLTVVRQAMWIGVWIAFCMWLQMNRSLGLAVAGLVAAVLAMFEILLYVRTRASNVFG